MATPDNVWPMTFAEVVHECATRLGVPGVAAAVLGDGGEESAFHGVTSVENPLPVDADTLFQSGSIGKTFTATVVLCLVERGEVDLDAPVRRYLPEFRLKDSAVAERVRVGQLFNHTAGWERDVPTDTGEGDDSLTRYVELMADLEQVSPLGATVTYNNAALSVAGRLIEKLTGSTYERAVSDLLLVPLGLDRTFFFPYDIMTRRFVAGHDQDADGRVSVARPWGLDRGGNPSGGMTTTAGDLMLWARFHLGGSDGDSDGDRVLSAELRRRMQQPTVALPGVEDEYYGISWLVRDVAGVRVVEHSGGMIGQRSRLVLVPDRGFALVLLANSSPNGHALTTELTRWALSEYVGIEEPPQPP